MEQCLSPSSKLSELWRKDKTALFQQAWGHESPDVGASSSQEEELWIMKPFLALLLHNSNFACGDFTDKPFTYLMASAIVQISAEVSQHLQCLVYSHLCQKVLG